MSCRRRAFEQKRGGRRRLGHISKRGDRYLRCMLIHGGRAVVLAAQVLSSSVEPLARNSLLDLRVRVTCCQRVDPGKTEVA